MLEPESGIQIGGAMIKLPLASRSSRKLKVQPTRLPIRSGVVRLRPGNSTGTTTGFIFWSRCLTFGGEVASARSLPLVLNTLRFGSRIAFQSDACWRLSVGSFRMSREAQLQGGRRQGNRHPRYDKE